MNKQERLKAAEDYAANIDKYSYLDEYAFTNRQVNQIAQDNAHLGFIAGAEAEAESKWISVDERTPIATESGHWDGLRSEFVLAVNRDRNYVIARVYEGKMDGIHFLDWVDSNDTILDGKHDEIIMWQYITP